MSAPAEWLPADVSRRRGGRTRSCSGGWAARALRVELVWLALLAPSLLFPGRFWLREWHPYLVLLLFAFWPLHLLRDRGRPATPISGAVLVVAVWLAVGIGVSVDPLRSWEAAGSVALGVAAFAAVVHAPAPARRPQRLAWVYLGSCGLLALAGPLLLGTIPAKLAFLPTQGPWLGALAETLGESVNPNVLAGALAPAAPLALALALYPGRPGWSRLAAGGLALLLAAVLLVSQSRGAYLAAGLGGLGVLALQPAVTRRPWRRPLVVLLVLAGVGLAWISWQLLTTPWAGDALGGLARRVEIWQRAYAALRDFPLTGLGFGLFGLLAPVLYPTFFAADAPVPHAHNLYLQIGVDLGVPGLVAMGAIWIGSVALLLGRLRDGRPAALAERALAAGTLAALVALWTHGLVDAASWSAKPAFLPWLLYSLAACLGAGARQSAPVEPPAPDANDVQFSWDEGKSP